MIDFEPSEEQALIRDTVGEFAKSEIRPRAREADEAGKIPADVLARAHEDDRRLRLPSAGQQADRLRHLRDGRGLAEVSAAVGDHEADPADFRFREGVVEAAQEGQAVASENFLRALGAGRLARRACPPWWKCSA